MYFNRQLNLMVMTFLAVLFSFSYADITLSLDGGDLNYESTADVAGFQFSHNGCVTNASGGDAAANGFTISASSGVVLGFSLTGSYIAAGSGKSNKSRAQVSHFAESGRFFYEMIELSKMGIPTICVVFGTATAGGAYQPGVSDYNIFIRNESTLSRNNYAVFPLTQTYYPPYFH